MRRLVVVLLSILVHGVSATPLLIAAGFQLVFAGYCLLLPHTAPNRHPRNLGDTLGLPAVRMLLQPGFRIFVLTSVAAQKAGPGMMLSFVIAATVCGLAALAYRGPRICCHPSSPCCPHSR